MRIGIGHPGHKDRVTRYVLGNYAKAEMDDLADMLGAIARRGRMARRRRRRALHERRRAAAASCMTIRSLFVTRLYEAELGDAALLADLAHSIRTLAADDGAGRRWSRDKGYKGYTSYASLDDLPRRDPAFADLRSC